MRSKLYFSLGVMVSKAPGLLRVPHSDGNALPAQQRQHQLQAQTCCWV